MTARRFFPLRLRDALVTALLLPVLWGQAAALNHIRGEIWSYRGDVPQWPLSTVVNVAFFADISDMDLPSRVVYYIVVVDGAGQEHPLLRFKWGQWVDLPGQGTPVNVYTSFRLSCDGQGGLIATPVAANFGFCNPGQAPREIRELTHIEVSAVQVQGNFGLALVDREGYRGADPPPADAFACRADAVEFDADAALAELAHKKSEQVNRLQNEDTGVIGIYFDPAGRNCTGTIRPGEPGTVYVIAKLAGLSTCGIAGAEFRFSGVPESWTTYPVANPEVLTLGDPFVDGVSLGSRCLRPESGSVVLYSVQVVATSEVNDILFHVQARDPPMNPAFTCPLLVLCDYPMFTMVCVEGLSCFVNSSTPRVCQRPVAVMASTWSQVKKLFR